ncbi:MAG: hypothetical protein AAF418_00845, partial [Pseudomonadota bacterium]
MMVIMIVMTVPVVAAAKFMVMAAFGEMSKLLARFGVKFADCLGHGLHIGGKLSAKLAHLIDDLIPGFIVECVGSKDGCGFVAQP